MSAKPVHECHHQIPAGINNEIKNELNETKCRAHIQPPHVEETVEGNQSARDGERKIRKH